MRPVYIYIYIIYIYIYIYILSRKFLRAVAKRRRKKLPQNSCDVAEKSSIVTLQIMGWGRGVRPVRYGTEVAEGDGRRLVFEEPVNHSSSAAIGRAGGGAGRTAGRTVEGGRAAEGSHQSSVSLILQATV